MKQNRLTEVETTSVVVKGQRVGEEWIGSMEWADTNYYIYNG